MLDGPHLLLGSLSSQQRQIGLTERDQLPCLGQPLLGRHQRDTLFERAAVLVLHLITPSIRLAIPEPQRGSVGFRWVVSAVRTCVPYWLRRTMNAPRSAGKSRRMRLEHLQKRSTGTVFSVRDGRVAVRCLGGFLGSHLRQQPEDSPARAQPAAERREDAEKQKWDSWD